MEEKFVPRPGQIDYTNIKRAPVINCILKRGDKILLVHRSPAMRIHPGVWNGISGFLDEEAKTVSQKVEEELREEAGIEPNNILSIKEGVVFEQEDPENNKTWIVHPVLVEVATDQIHLDWEAAEYAWVKPEEISRYNLLPGFDKVMKTFFP